MDITDAQPENNDEQDLQIQIATVTGLDEAEENLLLEVDGARFQVPVDGELRRLVRRARSTPPPTAVRPEPETQTEVSPQLTPREIQARMRAGESPEDIAAASSSDIDVEDVRRYESPILAERAYVISQAQATPITSDAESPLLGEITVDRLAARGVSGAELEWSAYRLPGADWTVELRFEAGERDRSATWSFDPRSRVITALDDESRWLTEPETPRDEPIPTRLKPVREWVYDVDQDGGVIGPDNGELSPETATEYPTDAEPDPLAQQQDLLDELSSRRGRRQPILDEDDEDPFDLMGEIPAAHPPASRPEEAVDAEILQLPEPSSEADVAAEVAAEIGDIPAVEAPSERDKKAPTQEQEEVSDASEPAAAEATDEGTETKKSKPSRRAARRASVPSWDEIVFGARTDG